MRRLVALALAGVLASALVPAIASAYGGPAFVVVAPPIPVPRVEVVAPYPGGYGQVWVPGYWSWGGPRGYYWVRGAWFRPPGYGAHWVPPYWAHGHGGHRWVGGHWSHSAHGWNRSWGGQGGQHWSGHRGHR